MVGKGGGVGGRNRDINELNFPQVAICFLFNLLLKQWNILTTYVLRTRKLW